MTGTAIAIVGAAYLASIAYFGLGGKSRKSRVRALLIATFIFAVFFFFAYVAASGG